jgi:hypothetical protein
VLASSADMLPGPKKHKIVICNDVIQARFVQFTYTVIKIENFEDFYDLVKISLDCDRCGVGLSYQRIVVKCVKKNESGTEASVSVEVFISDLCFGLCTASDVFLHFLYGIRCAGYTVKRTSTICMQRCLQRSPVTSGGKPYSPMMRALFLERGKRKPNGNTPYRRHSANMDKISTEIY